MFDDFDAGLSPRRRGNRFNSYLGSHRGGSIPAQAGEPPSSRWNLASMGVYPRAGGGTMLDGERPEIDAGSIPAQAGEPRREPACCSPPGVYPRAGGGTVRRVWITALCAGLSPRRRRNRLLQARDVARPGSIPAQAGEPRIRGQVRQRSRTRVYPRAGGGTVALVSTCPTVPGLSPRRRGNPLCPSR